MMVDDVKLLIANAIEDCNFGDFTPKILLDFYEKFHKDVCFNLTFFEKMRAIRFLEKNIELVDMILFLNDYTPKIIREIYYPNKELDELKNYLSGKILRCKKDGLKYQEIKKLLNGVENFPKVKLESDDSIAYSRIRVINNYFDEVDKQKRYKDESGKYCSNQQLLNMTFDEIFKREVNK